MLGDQLQETRSMLGDQVHVSPQHGGDVGRPGPC